MITLIANSDDKYKLLSNITYPCRFEYASKHKYNFLSYDYTGHYGKINALLDSFDKSEWLWWLDTDAKITNFDIKLESLISKEIVFTCDINGLNSGSMLFKTTSRVKECLLTILDRKSQYNIFPWFDQNGFAYQLWNMIDFISILPQRAMNSYPYKRTITETWQPGDFVLHCPGMSDHEKLSILSSQNPSFGS